MKKWLLPVAVLSWQTAVFAQQMTVKKSEPKVFDEAFRYLNGIGKNYDPAKAAELFRQAGARGDGASLNALGNLNAKGGAGFSKNIDTAIHYYLRAAQAGYSTGYYNLAVLYRDGNDVPQDFQKSARYCRAGADMDNSDCKRLLAYYCFKGFGVEQNYAEAFSLYEELAKSGLANAQYFLGLCYRNGYGTNANQQQAKKWLLLAASQGDYQAIHELTAEPQAENSSIHNPALQQQVENLKNYQEKLIAAASNDISGTYKGFAVYYDFSGRFVHQVVPLSLTLSLQHGGYSGIWTESNSLNAPVKGSFGNNRFSFDPATQYTRRNYYSYRDAEEYQFKAAQLSVNYIKDSVYLAGNMQFYSLSRREPGQPMYIVLSKKVEGNETAPDNLRLVLNPNPATTEVKASFTLAKPGKVNFEVIGTDGKTIASQAGEALLPAGTYTIPINVQQLVPGSYNLRMTTSTGAAQTKQFIKL
jgi:hypothetical protein